MNNLYSINKNFRLPKLAFQLRIHWAILFTLECLSKRLKVGHGTVDSILIGWIWTRRNLMSKRFAALIGTEGAGVGDEKQLLGREVAHPARQSFERLNGSRSDLAQRMAGHQTIKLVGVEGVRQSSVVGKVFIHSFSTVHAHVLLIISVFRIVSDQTVDLSMIFASCVSILPGYPLTKSIQFDVFGVECVRKFVTNRAANSGEVK